MEAHLVRQSGVIAALAACAAPAPVAHPASVASWTRDGLHVTGAPPLDRDVMKWLEAYDDATGYRVLDLDPNHGLLVEYGGELEQIVQPGQKPFALSPYELDVDRAWFVAGGVEFTADTDGDETMQLWTARLDPRDAKRILDRPAVPPPERALPADAVAVSSDGKVAAYTNGDATLRVFDWRSSHEHIVPLADGVFSHVRFARTGHVLAFSFTDARHPRDAYTYDLDSEQLTAWTHAQVTVPAVAPKDETIASFDQTPIHALVYRPAHVRGVIVELHGGPEDRFTPSWSPFAQALVARGYAVVQANVRGSSGYGAAFAALDDGPRREDAIRDVGAVIEWARRIDPQPVLLGTSYGGYLALSAAATHSVRAVIALSPIPDLPDFLAHTARARADERRAEYGDERDPKTREFLARISPRPDAIHVPVLIAHGQRDPRVPIPAVDRFVAAARAAGARVWYARADDEGHIFSKTANRMIVQSLVLQLLEYHRER